MLHNAANSGEEFVARRKHTPADQVIPFTCALRLIAARAGTANIVRVKPDVFTGRILAFCPDGDTVIPGHYDDRVERAALLGRHVVHGAMKWRIGRRGDNLVDHIL